MGLLLGATGQQIIEVIRYLKFIHKGRSCDIPSTYKYIYGIWLPKTEYRMSIPFELEYYGELYLGPDNENSVSEIYIPLEFSQEKTTLSSFIDDNRFS
ncbi:GyrI-like domain-containing protein [Paenibacillus odorifer]|uniref:GyrI-like domain-containing protein n=1 Tax=Paenibacillus sp. FSL H7-0735 TaxID=2954736 RepID=UPI0009D74DD8